MADRIQRRIDHLEARLQRLRDVLERTYDPGYRSAGDQLEELLRDELEVDEEAEYGEVIGALQSRIVEEYDSLREPLAAIAGLDEDKLGSAGSPLASLLAGGVALFIQAAERRPEQLERRIQKLEKRIETLRARQADRRDAQG
jgi:chromosome segregation ATPase